MIAFISSNIAPIMFAGLVIFLLMGFPVAFSLAACGMFFGFIGIELGLLPPTLFQALPLRIFGIMQNDTLLAVPFFTFMGLMPQTLLQGVSEFIKRIAYLRGLIDDPTKKAKSKSDEEEFAEFLRQQTEGTIK